MINEIGKLQDLKTNNATEATLLAISGDIQNLDISAVETIISNEIQKIFSLMESQRGHHTGVQNLFYWDPTNGNDSNDGLTLATAKLTFANINTNLVTNNNHDVVIIVPGTSGGQTVITEKIDLSKNYTFLRGPGRDIAFRPTTSGASTVIMSAEGCEIRGAVIETFTSGSADAVEITGDFSDVHDVWVDYSRGHGIKLTDCSHCRIYDFIIQDAAIGGSGVGLLLDGTGATTTRNFIWNGRIMENFADGIQIKGANATHNFIFGDGEGMFIHGNTGWGINEFGGADHTIVVGTNIHIGHNTLGNINLTGADSVELNITQYATESDLKLAMNKDVSETFDRETDSLEALRDTLATTASVESLSADVEYTNRFLNNNVTMVDKLIVQPVQGNFSYATIKKQEVEVKAGDTPEIPYDLNADITGYIVEFGVKETYDSETYIIEPKDITGFTLIPSAGTGTIPLSADETNIERGDYIGEIKLTKDDIVNTPSEFRLRILSSVFIS